ncbi:zf-CCHC domain-containing protein [Tanacetum coccineum]
MASGILILDLGYTLRGGDAGGGGVWRGKWGSLVAESGEGGGWEEEVQRLKALDEGYSSKNFVRKFLKALHPIWRAKVTAIEESKDLTSLSLDELIGNLKVHEMIIKKDSKIVKDKGERKSIALKAKKDSSDEECLTSESEDEEYAMAVRDFKKFFKRRECPKPPKDKNQKTFIGGSWSDSDEEDGEKAKDETCLVAQASNDVCSDSSYFSDENSSIDDLTLDNEYDKLNQKPSGDKLGLGFNSFEASTSGSKEIKFVKPQKEMPSGGGPLNNEGSPNKVQMATKAIKGPLVCSPESEKSVSFQKSILGPRPKHIIVNNVKILIASDNEICLRDDLEPDEWIKDTGCSKHMMGNQKLLSTYKAYNGGNVILGSNLHGNITVKGMISNDSLIIDNVEHVDNLRFNLLSIG